MVDQLENISLSFLVDNMVRQRGGVAPNIAYSIAILGGRPSIMATAGQDFAEYRAWLEEVGVDTSAIVTVDDVFTASFFVTTDLDQNQIASFYTGAMAFANKLTFKKYAPDADLATISPNDPQAMQNYIVECKELGIPYIYDPSQQTIGLSGEELYAGIDGCYLLAVNSYEFHLIQERTGLGQKRNSGPCWRPSDHCPGRRFGTNHRRRQLAYSGRSTESRSSNRPARVTLFDRA